MLKRRKWTLSFSTIWGLSAYYPIFYWAYLSTDCDMPCVLLTNKCVVGKYSLIVIHYVVGWVLQKVL